MTFAHNNGGRRSHWSHFPLFSTFPSTNIHTFTELLVFIFAFVYDELATLIIATRNPINPKTTYRQLSRVLSSKDLICDNFEFRDGEYRSSVDMSSFHCLSRSNN